MIPSGSNSPPVARVIDPVIETLTTGPAIPSAVVSVSITGSITLATGELLDPEGIIGPVVSVSITGSITLATGGLLVGEGIIDPLVSVSITGSITLTTGGLLVPEGSDRNTDYWTDDTIGD
jgi:hypothetical protein